MISLFYYVRWILRGKPMITYPGCNCGLCGKWYDEVFSVRNYYTKENIVVKVGDEYFFPASPWDTWGICPKGTGCQK